MKNYQIFVNNFFWQQPATEHTTPLPIGRYVLRGHFASALLRQNISYARDVVCNFYVQEIGNKMKCTLAFLVDDTIHNYVRKKSIEINKIIKNGFLGSLLPPHISLKQPFAIDDIEIVEKYFDRLSSEIKPMKLKIGPTYLWENVIGLNVQESNELRECHNKINKELKSICKNLTALYDGLEYHFHLTIAFIRKG